MTSSTSYSNRQAWLRVGLLALAAFIFNTTEFMPVGLLNDISISFNLPVHEIGLMLTIYAWVVAVFSLPAMLLTRKMERRRLLSVVFVIFIISHILSSVSWSYPVLVVSRIGIALAHSIFWSITASLAVRIGPPGKEHKSLALLATGTVLAMVLGVPLGRIIGNAFGWRLTFSLVAMAATMILLVLGRSLPLLPSENAGSFSSLPTLLKRPLLLTFYALTLLMVTGHFMAYSYIDPFSIEVAHLSSMMVTGLLLAFGITGIVGSLLFSRLGGKFPRTFMFATVAVMTLCLFLLLPVAHSHEMLMVLVAIWGASIMCLGLSLQARILEQASDATDVGMAVYSSLYNVGIGGGALLGSIVISHQQLSLVGIYGGGLALVGTLLYGAVAGRSLMSKRIRHNGA
ncbi:Sugar efflux transporter [Halomonadaceae bacterium LMG 33818]|uniref:sugar transporter n=1 Tax=Cernens ardua TaxID=3402176 RepID=UPI003EDC5239